MNRRTFLASVSAFVAPAAMKGDVSSEAPAVPSGEVKLKVGIVSDTHVAFRWQKEKLAMLKKVLRMFDAEKVDAVMMPGDIAESPIESFELLAETYFEVFPNDKGSDGRHVERLFVTGNHDLEEWYYGKKKDETLEQCIERWRDKAFAFHREEVWQRLFKEPYKPYFLKEVKGYKFLLRHWPDLYFRKEPYAVEAAFSEYGEMLAKERVFFYCQHEQPSATVNCNYKLLPGGEWYSLGQTKGSELATKVLSKYPNCVSLTGHSHYPLNDERSIWQGEFTAVHCGHMAGWAFAGPGRENGHEGLWDPPQEMEPFNYRDVHDVTIMTVYDDAIRFQRLDVKRDAPLGPDWVVPIDPAKRPYAWDRHAEASKPPKFAAKAKVSVKEIKEGKDRAGNRHPQIEVSCPPVTAATGGDRAYDYSVRLEMLRGDIRLVKDEKRVFSPHFAHPEKYETEQVKCLFPRSAAPKKRTMRVVVTPYNCWLKAGEPIISSNFNLK